MLEIVIRRIDPRFLMKYIDIASKHDIHLIVPNMPPTIAKHMHNKVQSMHALNLNGKVHNARDLNERRVRPIIGRLRKGKSSVREIPRKHMLPTISTPSPSQTVQIYIGIW